MTTAEQTKAKLLPIEKREFGYVQKSSFANPDLIHEEVLDLDSPFARIVSSSTLVFSFLLCGDQNAGKSTFLQAFTHHPDRNFIDVLSDLPILSSSFVNTRFRPSSAAPGWQPRDELPFLDTDIARGTVMLTRDDFVFFFSERGIPVPDVFVSPECDARYVVVQFIELGGDHLDLLADAAHAPPDLADVVSRSLELIRTASRTMYFLNMQTIEVDALAKRLRFLCSTFPPGHEVVFTLMRGQQEGAGDEIARVRQMLGELGKHEPWSLRVASIRNGNHLTTGGDIDGHGLMDTLESLLRMADDRAIAGADGLLVPHVFAAVDKLGGEWLTGDKFEEFVEALHAADMPVTTMIQGFERVADALCSGFAAIRHSAEGHGDIEVTLGREGHSVLRWRTPVSWPRRFAIRMPRHQGIREALSSFVRRNVPADMWFARSGSEQPSALAQVAKEQLAAALSEPMKQLESSIVDTWRIVRVVSSHVPPNPAEIREVFSAFVSLAEDLCLVNSFLESGHTSTTFAQSLQPVDDNSWQSLISATTIKPEQVSQGPANFSFHATISS